MAQQHCPDRDTLEQLLLGKMPGEDAVALEEHLLDCDACATVTDTIDARDAVTAAFAQSPGLPAGDTDLLARLVERGKQLGSEVETIRSDETLLVGQPGHDDSVSPTCEVGIPADDVPADEIDFLGPPESPEEIGRLGGYRVLSVLGIGGMGIVFRAEDPKLKRKVALKAMKPAVAASRSARDRFLREAAAAAAIEHDHIITIYQVGEDRGIPFIAMRYLEGESLQTRLEREGRLSPLEGVRLGQQIASGLAAAYEQGLIHRDIKPDNIWLQQTTGRAKILDFGLARTTSNDAGLTQSGMVLGTPKYMAPEQAEGKPVDHRCDLFSLGSVLYHLLSGTAPFRGGNVTAVLIAVAHRDPEPLATLCPELPPDLVNLITRLLSKDRNSRPATAAEVANALAAIESQLKAGDESIGGTPATIADSSLAAKPQGEAVAPTIIAAAEDAPRPPRRRRPPTMWGWFGALLLAGIITIVNAKGTVTIDISEELQDDVEVQIVGDGDEVAVLDKGNNWTVRLKGGEYSLNLTGGDDKFRLEDETLTVSRFGRSLVRMRYTPAGTAADTPPRGAADSHGPAATSGGGWHGSPADAPPPAIAPFDANEARARQEAWAKYLGVPVEYENSIGMTFRLIPPGEFLMGSTHEEIQSALEVAGNDKTWQERINSETPQHKVILTQPIYVGVTEVTQSQYEQVMGTNPSHFSATGEGKDAVANLETGNHPVEMVSWNDAAEFCAKLSQQEELKPFYFRSGATVTPLNGSGYRLPTEAEWESACRAGTTTRFWCGDADQGLISTGWFNSNSGGRTHAAGELKANPFGLHDVHGNLIEWVQDSWDPEFYAQFSDRQAIDPSNPFSPGSRQVIRDGSWYNKPSNCRASCRNWYSSWRRESTIGFRVVLPVDAVKQLANSDQDSEQAPTYALDFDGQDDRVELPLTCDGDTPFTVEAVVRINDWSENLNSEIVDNTSNGGFSLTASQLGFYFAARIGNRYQQVRASLDPQYLRRPVALAGVRSGSTLKLYVDGKLIAQETFSGAYKPSASPITIGSSTGDRQGANAAPRDFHGQILKVRLSDTVRAAGDLIAAEQEVPEVDEQTLALYRIDEGAGDVLRDSSGNGHHGTIHGATWVRMPADSTENAREEDRRAPADAAGSIDRTVALQLFSLAENPDIIVRTDDGTTLHVPTREELPKVPFELLEIGGLHFRDLSGFDFAQFGQLRQLEVLSLNLATGVRPEQVDKLRRLSKLRKLGLHGLPVSAEQLQQILAGTPRLQELGLFWCEQITDDAMKAIARHETLTNLGLPGENLTAAGVVEFGRLKNLEALTLGDLPAESGILAQILTLKKLERLHMRRSVWLDDAQLERLVVHPTLSDLSIDESSISDEALRRLGSEDRWRRIELKGTRITDGGLEYLTGLKGLQSLHLHRTRTTPDGVKRLQKALPQCRIYTDQPDDQAPESDNPASLTPHQPVSPPSVNPPAPASPERLIQILAAVQECGGTMLVWDDGKQEHTEIRTRQDIPMDLQSGPSLLFKNVESFDDEQLRRVAAACLPFPQHRTLSLDLSGTQVSSSAFGRLSELPLHSLVLNRIGGIDDSISGALARFETLDTLGLQQTAITDATVSAVVKLESLRVLNLRGTAVTEKCVPDLARSSLRELDVSRTAIAADAVMKLHEALPGCTIHWDGGVVEPEPARQQDH